MTTRTFHKYTITYQVLTEEPIPDDAGMQEIVGECEEGGDVGWIITVDHADINGAEAAKELTEVKSEPGFFQLDEEGNDID